MYLFKTKRFFGVELKTLDPKQLQKHNPKLYELVSPYMIEKYGFKMFNKEVGYWRKANQIHYWFVSNVQDDEDDCGYYEVSKEQLTRLLEECQKVKEDPKSARIHLPTSHGFFFGGKEYDEIGRASCRERVSSPV